MKPANFSIARKDAGYIVTVDYEVRRPLIANFDIVGHFNAEQVLSRVGE